MPMLLNISGVRGQQRLLSFQFCFLVLLKSGHDVLNHCEICNTQYHMAYIKKTLGSLEEKHLQKNLTDVKVFNERLLQIA